jgi:anti-sigma factor ChrR (cupin superfamily)
MPSCREAREHLTEYAEGALSWRERLSLRLHLLLCGACNAFYRSLRGLPGLARLLLAHPEAPAPAEAVQALENVLRRLGNKTPE